MSKKWASFFTLLMLISSLLLFFSPVFSANPEVSIKLDGKIVSGDVPSYIDENGRTIVPVRFVSEELGFDVNWDGKNRRVVIIDNMTEVVFLIGEKTALVNENEMNMDAPAVINNGRTMVPIRFIAETFNIKVSWCPDTRTVGLNTPETAPETPAKPVPPSEEPAPADPSPGYSLDSAPKTALVMKPVVNVRSSPGTGFPVTSTVSFGDWLEVLSEQGGWYQVRLENGGTGWVAGWLMATCYDPPGQRVKISPNENPGSIIASWEGKSTAPNEKEDLPVITNIKVIEMEYGVQILIEGNSSLEIPQALRLNDPSRKAFDLSGLLEGEDYISTMEVNCSPVIRVRGAQFEEDTVRVVVDLKENTVRSAINKNIDGSIEIEILPVFPLDRTVVIDPGHGSLRNGGGSDPGAIGPAGTTERDVVTSIAYKLGEVLINNDYPVLFTREGNTRLTLEERAHVANLSGGIFVSIHANAHPNSEVMGTETFYPATAGEDSWELIVSSKKLAECIQEELLVHLKRPNRGVKQANFAVLRHSQVPAVLVEVAFVSNPVEERLLSQNEFQEQAAFAIARGIEKFIQQNH